MVAGVGFLVAVGAHRRMARGPGSPGGSSGARGQHAATPPPRARRARAAEQDGPDQGAHDPYETDPRPIARYSADPHEVDSRALRDLAIVRYDALQEMSGQLSF